MIRIVGHKKEKGGYGENFDLEWHLRFVPIKKQTDEIDEILRSSAFLVVLKVNMCL